MNNVPRRILERHAQECNITFEEAEMRFDNLIDFLSSHEVGSVSPSTEVDEAWHCFILHTVEYTDYCDAQFGKYIHHEPQPNPSSLGKARCR